MHTTKILAVWICLHKIGWMKAGLIKVGGESSVFKYSKEYVEQNLPPLNPSTLNWRDGKRLEFHASGKQPLDRTFCELLPGQNDWGNQLLMSRFPEYVYMNNSQKLAFLENRTVGGLCVCKADEKPGLEDSIGGLTYLDNIRDESILFYQKQIKTMKFVGAFKPLTSYGGMRPKCMYEENGEFWIVKFNAPDDPYDMALAEQIAMDMSRDVGLKTAESKVVKLPSGENAFFSKRFDREGDERYHSLALFALVPGNEGLKKATNLPGSPSSFIQALIRRYSDFENMDTLNVVTKMLLDIGTNNTDNHLRNLRIILNKNLKWELSPMYDIIFNPNNQSHVYNPAGLPLGELFLENPDLANTMMNELGVSSELIEQQIGKVKNVLYNWESYCDKYNLKLSDKQKIGNAVSLGLTRREYTVKHQAKNTINLPKLKPT